MAWIESHQTLARHPRTMRLTAALGISKPAAIGHLHLLWWWALDYAQDGDLTRFAAAEIAIAAEWDGMPETFVDGLTVAGFLEEGQLHDWHDYTGRIVAQRARNAERMRQTRAAHVQSTMKATVPNTTQPDQTEPTALDRAFESFWLAYPRRVGKRAARAAFERALKRAPAEVIMAGTERYSADPNRDPQFTAHPTTWLNQDRWSDDPLPPRDNGFRPRTATDMVRARLEEVKGAHATSDRTREPAPRQLPR